MSPWATYRQCSTCQGNLTVDLYTYDLSTKPVSLRSYGLALLLAIFLPQRVELSPFIYLSEFPAPALFRRSNHHVTIAEMNFPGRLFTVPVNLILDTHWVKILHESRDNCIEKTRSQTLCVLICDACNLSGSVFRASCLAGQQSRLSNGLVGLV